MVPVARASLVACGLAWASASPTWAGPPTQAAEPEGGSSTEASAAEDDEPLLQEIVDATLVYPQEQGEIQLTLEPSYARRRDGYHLGVLVHDVEVGATDWLQFELAWTAPLVRGGHGRPTEAGVGSLEPGAQLSWVHMRGSPFSGALAFNLDVPVGGKQEQGYSEGMLVYQPFVTLAVDSTQGRAQVFTNLGAELSAQEQRPFVHAGVIGAVWIARPHVVISSKRPETYLTPGVGVILGDDWQLVAGVSVGLSHAADPFAASLILLYQIKTMKD